MNSKEYDCAKAVFEERQRFYHVMCVISSLIENEKEINEQTRKLIKEMHNEVQELYLVCSDIIHDSEEELV